jgi:DNA-binding beta-propeller fold protein YncE
MKLFVALTTFSLTILFSNSAHAAGGLAVDGAGNLFVANYSSQRIFKFTPEGKKSTFASGIGPDKMAVDGAGNLFVADDSSQRIFKFTPEGKKSTFASGTPVSGTAVYLALDGAGDLFVAWGGESILKFTPDGKNSTFASGGNHGDMAVDGAGNLFVVEFARGAGSSILKFTPDGKKSTFATGVSAQDYGVEILGFDHDGNLFVGLYVPDPDVSYYSILKFTPDGTKSTFASGLTDPVDPIFDDKGNLFVGDKVSDSVLKFTPDGKKSTIATGIRLNGMALGAAGNLFVLEDGSDLIFKFTPDGTRSTFVSDRGSPDKQWEYQCSAHDENPRIVKTGTSQTVLDLSEEVPEWGNEAKIVWAPDSKRFALNYTKGGRPLSSATALYQLRGNKWVALRSPETDQTTKPVEQAQFAQLRKMHLPIPGHKLWYTKKVLKWIDGSTALLYSGLGVMGDDDSWPETGFLFTLKFDAAGKWKIVETHRMSYKEVKEHR